MCQAADALRRAATAPAVSEPPSAVAATSRREPRHAAGHDRLVLLGTAGGSNPKSTRCGYANAVIVGEAAYVIDCGEGVHRQAWRAGISTHSQRRPPGGATVEAVFLTHLHSDHVIDLPNLLLGFWPNHHIDVYGPGPAGLPIPAYPPEREVELLYPEAPTPGARDFLDHVFRAFAYNINVRMADEGRPNPTANVVVHEIGVERDGYRPDVDLGVVASGASGEAAAPAMEPVEIRPLDDNGVRVTAILVQHAPVFPALAYRFDTPSGSVVFSGDTGPCENIVRLAAGADILVHDTIDVEFIARRVANLPNREAIVNHLAGSHTAPEDAARLAARAGVRTLVLSHLVPGDGELSEAEWEARARPFFDGDVVCGVDLDTYTLAASTIQ